MSNQLPSADTVLLGRTDELHERRLEILLYLDDDEFLKPMHLGAWDASHHSSDLLYLVKRGLAERGGYRSSQRRVNKYRRSEGGRLYLEAMGYEKTDHGYVRPRN